jgi:hypothetical protein
MGHQFTDADLEREDVGNGKSKVFVTRRRVEKFPGDPFQGRRFKSRQKEVLECTEVDCENARRGRYGEC